MCRSPFAARVICLISPKPCVAHVRKNAVTAEDGRARHNARLPKEERKVLGKKKTHLAPPFDALEFARLVDAHAANHESFSLLLVFLEQQILAWFQVVRGQS